MKLQKGFTLIEVMIVVVIIGILASIAIPAYNDYVTRGKLVEAMSTLSDLRIRMEQSYQDNYNYGAVPACAVAMPASPIVQYFTFSCVSLNANATGAQSYLLTATGISAKGTGNFIYTLDETNAKTSNTPWGISGTCWVKKTGGTC